MFPRERPPSFRQENNDAVLMCWGHKRSVDSNERTCTATASPTTLAKFGSRSHRDVCTFASPVS